MNSTSLEEAAEQDIEKRHQQEQSNLLAGIVVKNLPEEHEFRLLYDDVPHVGDDNNNQAGREGDRVIEHAGVEDLLGIDHGGKDKMYKVDIGNNYLKYNVNVIVTDSSINGRDKDYTDECNEAKKRELGFSHLVNIRKRK